jgi:hypothetical protein
MSELPQQFSWVKALSECSVKGIFSALYRGAQADAEEATLARKERFPGYNLAPFEVQPNTKGNAFIVMEQGNLATEVRFILCDDRVAICMHDREYAVRPTLDSNGKCKLRIDNEEQELEEWQVRRRALQGLFFES